MRARVRVSHAHDGRRVGRVHGHGLTHLPKVARECVVRKVRTVREASPRPDPSPSPNPNMPRRGLAHLEGLILRAPAEHVTRVLRVEGQLATRHVAPVHVEARRVAVVDAHEQLVGEALVRDHVLRLGALVRVRVRVRAVEG